MVYAPSILFLAFSKKQGKSQTKEVFWRVILGKEGDARKKTRNSLKQNTGKGSPKTMQRTPAILKTLWIANLRESNAALANAALVLSFKNWKKYSRWGAASKNKSKKPWALCRRAGIDAALVRVQFVLRGCAHHRK